MAEETIFHITARDDWLAAKAAGEYRAGSLTTQGFIHASTLTQVISTADRFYRGQDGLVLLCIDTARVLAPIKEEPASGPASAEGLFPHIYGPLNLDAVTRVLDFPRREDGAFDLPPELRAVAEGRRVTVLGTNYEGGLHWKHGAWLLLAEEGRVITATNAGTQVETERGEYISPYNTRAHYWTDRWFNVIRLETPGEGLYGYYCNISTPLLFDGETVSYVDLLLDVRVVADAGGALDYQVVDEDEFEEARLRYAYDETFVANCWAAVNSLVAMIEARAFPFDA